MGAHAKDYLVFSWKWMDMDGNGSQMCPVYSGAKSKDLKTAEAMNVWVADRPFSLSAIQAWLGAQEQRVVEQGHGGASV